MKPVVSKRLEKNKKAPARHKAEDDYLLTTKLFCGYCGAYLCGESGTSRTGIVHHYYKCVSVKKKRTECRKKPVRKQWIEDLVVRETMDMLNDTKAIEEELGRENNAVFLEKVICTHFFRHMFAKQMFCEDS